MIIHMKPKATENDIEKVVNKIRELGYEIDISRGEESIIIGIKGDVRRLDENLFLEIPAVEKVFRVSKKWKEVSRQFHQEYTVVNINDKVKVGEGYFTVIAGPCAIESEYQLLKTAELVKEAGAHILRGGAYKPRTSTYDFQGLEEKGLELLAKAKKKFDMPIVTEIMDHNDIDLYKQYNIDIYQVGARNSQNSVLLKKLSNLDKPVLHKRGRALSVDEFLNAAEYIYSGNRMGKGNHNLILCERGVLSFEEDVSRNLPDIPGIIYIKQKCHLPIIGDPSHSGGWSERVPQLSYAMTAAGTDGLIIEAHHDPENAICDGQQAVTGRTLKEIIDRCKEIYGIVHHK